jgi:UDP-N-acetylglucosamine:LPS N-acetylglucosamine transferase
MKTIAFYISDHGFGHASRNIPIIGYILEVNLDIRVIVKTGKDQGEFIKNVLEKYKSRLNIYFETIDVGLIIKSGSLEIDKEELKKKLKQYISTWDDRSLKEVEFLKQNSVNIVVSDIVPWIFKSTSKLNIPSLLISNFTWIDIYEEYFNGEIYDEYIRAYELADKSLLYLLYIDNMKSYLKNFEEVGLCCRSFNEENINKIKREHANKIVFITVGRSVELKDKINVENLNYDFIVTEGINLEGNNVIYLPREITNTQDYIKASDYIITKAGWGTIAEILCANKKCAVLSRNSIAEDRNTIEKLKHMNLAVEVKYEDDFDIENILKQLNELNFNDKDYEFENHYKDIANKIVSCMGER